MFGSTTAFGKSSNGPFGSPSVFGQNNNASSNVFAPNPFGISTPFGSSTGGSVFGGTSTGVFGVNSPPVGQLQQSTFGSPSPPAFGNAITAFGAPSAPACVTSSSSPPSAFGQSSNTSSRASSVFGQNSNAITAFGAPSAPAFVTSSSSPPGAFGQSSNTSSRASSVFGQISNASSNPFTPKLCGSTTSIGSPTEGSAFGGTSTGVFGVNSSPFGLQSTYGSPSAPAFGTSTTAFGAPLALAFGTSSSSSSGPSIFGKMPAIGGIASCPNQYSSFESAFQQTQTTSGTNPFGSSPSFGLSTQSTLGSTSTSQFGRKSATSFTFGTSGAFDAAKPLGSSSSSVLSTSAVGALRSPAFVGQFNSATCSSTAPSFSGTWSSSGAQSTTAIFATTGIGQFSFRGHQRGSRLAPYTATVDAVHDRTKQPAAASDRSSMRPKLQSISGMDINKDKNHEELRWEDYQSGDKGGIHTGGSTIKSNSFGPSATLVQSPVNLFNSAPFSNPFAHNQTSFTANAPSTTSTSNSHSAPGFNCGLSSANTQPPPMFQSVVPLAQTFSFPGIVPPVSQPNMFSPSSLPPMSNLAGPSQTTPFLTTPLEPTQIAQTGLSGFTGTTGVLDQSTFNPPSCTQNTVVSQAVPSVSPFGVLPSTPQLSIGHLGSTPPIRYGISSMPVIEKPAAAVRGSSLLTSRNLSHRQIKLPARKYDPKSDCPKVPFFSDDEGMPTAAKGGAVFFRRENPRALVVLPAEQWPQTSNTEKMSQLVHVSLHVYKNGTISAEVPAPSLVNGSLHQNEDDHSVENTKSNDKHKERGTDVEASMPRLSHSDYYTKPQIPELVANERAKPGFCRRVKNFVVGRHGYGRIKFLGETDVRHLDLDLLVKFNNREVMVYTDEREKPPVGEGLNKAAEVTLLNVKCIDKMGNRYMDGPRVDKYREMLIKKAKEQGAEVISYDPVKGEWKFRVQHFSRYAF